MKGNVTFNLKICGFSLIELLTVLGIVIILVFLTIPYYTQYMMRENRIEAKSMLLRLASAMERYHLTVATYRDVSLVTLNYPEYIAHGSYQLGIQYASEDEYLLTAHPLGKQAELDQACGILLLNSQRRKFISGPARNEDCWE